MSMMHRPTWFMFAMVALLAWASPANARVTRIVIDSTTLLDSGAYESVSGRAFGELDPSHPLNAIIQDIDLGSPDGKVRYVASFLLVKPTDMSQASGLMWQDVPNRGGRITLAAASRAEGDIGLSSGWQGDNSGSPSGLATTVPTYAEDLSPHSAVQNNEWVKVPVAKNLDGGDVTGLVFGRIVNRSGTASQQIFVQANQLPYKPATLDTTQATLVSRDHETMEGVVTGETTIPSTDWAWAKCPTGWAAQTPLVPTDPPEICLKNGFAGNKLYQVVFTAKDPYVLGVGFAAFRDVASFFKYETADDFGNHNPAAGAIRWSISRGSSQSGNFLRGFLHLGFNQDEAGRQLHDGTWPIIAGRRIALNFRWAQPDGVLELYQAGSEGPPWQTVNALRYHFRRWVMQSILPPPSRYPTLRGAKSERNLVEPTKDAMGFPTIPVAAATAGWRTTAPEPGFINPVLDYDWGPEFNPSAASGVPTNILPPIKQVIPMMVPRVDSDGNELGGVPVVLRDAPLGTYLGWNITFAGFHKDQLCDYVGGMIPFAVKKADKVPGDPRPSLEERYKDHAGYVAAVAAAAANAVAQGFLLQQDADALIAQAAASNVLNP